MSSLRKGDRRRAPESGWRHLEQAAAFLFGIFVLVAIRYQTKLFDYGQWGDESETIVAAKMLAAGYSLYSQIFNHHGPLTFLPGFLLEKMGNFGVVGHRLPIALLQIAAALSIYFSPLLKSNFTRWLYMIAVISVMLLFLPDIFGHMYLYQTLAGLLLAVILAQYTLPAIASAEHLTTRRVVLGNALIASLPFLAITYLPVALVLFLASLRKGSAGRSLAALTGGAVANIAFLAYIGSIPGYLAFHIYLNSTILPQYNGGQSALQLILNVYHTTTGSFRQFATFLILAAATYFLARRERGLPWRSMLLALGIASLLMRGNGFHGLPYFYSLLAVPLIFFHGRDITSLRVQLVTLAYAALCIAKLSLLLPEDQGRLESRKIPATTEFAQLVKRLTQKDDRIIVYSFQNYQYIAADRLPASGHFFYLPWQEKYNEDPKFGIRIDACKEIAEYRPKIMYIDKWKVWGLFPWNSYASCIQKLIDSDYVQWPERPYYIRKDLVTADMGIPAGPRRINEPTTRTK